MLSAQDIKELDRFFPKLKLQKTNAGSFLKGAIDISDNEDRYLKTFEIAIEIPLRYPYGVPILIELSNIIPRHDQRHITDEGICCVEISHVLEKEAKRGLSIIAFLKKYVVPFLTNQIFFDVKGFFANGDYRHGDDGILQFYKEDLELSISQSILLLEHILGARSLYRNEICICGSGKKFKNCHIMQVEFLKAITPAQLSSDLQLLKSKK